MSLVEGGYPIDLVFRLLLHSINDIDNQYGASSRAHAADPEFYPLIDELRKAQGNNVFALRVKKTEDNQNLIMVFNKKGQNIAGDGGLVRRLLGLKEAGNEFRVGYGSVSTADDEIALLTRSIIEISSDISFTVEVPPEHVAEKRVTPTMQVEGEGFKPPLIGIHHSAKPPEDAFVAVEYRDTWFWIDDRDDPSKKFFSFLMFVMILTETGGKDGAPIMTISAGR